VVRNPLTGYCLLDINVVLIAYGVVSRSRVPNLPAMSWLSLRSARLGLTPTSILIGRRYGVNGLACSVSADPNEWAAGSTADAVSAAYRLMPVFRAISQTALGKQREADRGSVRRYRSSPCTAGWAGARALPSAPVRKRPDCPPRRLIPLKGRIGQCRVRRQAQMQPGRVNADTFRPAAEPGIPGGLKRGDRNGGGRRRTDGCYE
jgi:hypothetical protein